MEADVGRDCADQVAGASGSLRGMTWVSGVARRNPISRANCKTIVVGPREAIREWHSYPRREFAEIQKLPAFSDVMPTTIEPALLIAPREPTR